jgi:hypothetical protein
MSLILSGTDGLSDVDGSAATPAIRGTDANTGIFFPAADTIAFAEGGTEVARFDSSGNFGIGGTPDVRLNVISAGTTQMRIYNTANTVYGRFQTETASFLIQTDTNHPLNFATNNGAVAMQIDTSGNLKFNSGYGTAATAYGCRAWVNFNGTGTPAIRASGNVSSITDIAAGTYTVNFTTALPDANYSGLITSGFASGVREDILGFAYTDAPYAPTTGGYTVKFVRADTNVNVDTNVAMVAIFR